MQTVHKMFINYYYDGLEQQINYLIDNKYRPRLIRQVIEQDVTVFKDPIKKDESIFNAIQEALVNNKEIKPKKLEKKQSEHRANGSKLNSFVN